MSYIVRIIVEDDDSLIEETILMDTNDGVEAQELHDRIIHDMTGQWPDNE